MKTGRSLLEERRYPEIDTFKVEIFPNESQHRGFPHCKVTTDTGSVTVGLENCKIVAGDAGRWNRTIEKTIALEKTGLMKFWDEMRPDDQKLT